MAASDHNDETFSDGTPLPEEPAGAGGKGPSPAQVLVQMAEDDYRLIRADDGRTYAVPRNGPNIAIPLASKSGSGVRARLAASLRRRTGQVATGSALSDCVNVLEGEASEQDPQPVFLRMARHTEENGQPCVVVDMGTETGQAIIITPGGWRIDAQAPVIFPRSELTHPLVEPVPGGSLEGLRALTNLSEEDYRLAIGWVVVTDIPHPILFVQGEQGTAKSNLIRSLLSLIDPQPAADREAPGSQREWAIFARASWAFSFDNVTEISEWLSNSLCKGVTGDAVLQRALHSDEDIVVFSFQRVIAMTTIAIKTALAGDLVDRLLLIEPEVLDVRLSEADVRAARATALPQALGAVHGRGRCSYCLRTQLLRVDGTLISHTTRGGRCPGQGTPPAEDVPLASWLPIQQGLTPHGLRHSHQPWMDDAQIPYVLQSERMGHEVPGMRGTYAHPSPEMRTALTSALQHYWEAALKARRALAPRSGVPILDAMLADSMAR